MSLQDECEPEDDKQYGASPNPEPPPPTLPSKPPPEPEDGDDMRSREALLDHTLAEAAARAASQRPPTT